MYITILIVLLWFCIVCTAPACFSTFLSIYYRPYSSWKFLIFLYTSLLTFFADNIIIDWLMNPCIPVVRVACASIINEREVSITVLCLQCSPCYTAVRIKNCSKSMSIITVATTMVLHTPLIVWNWTIHCPSLSAMFDLLHCSSTNQEVFEKHLCRKSSHYEKH